MRVSHAQCVRVDMSELYRLGGRGSYTHPSLYSTYMWSCSDRIARTLPLSVRLASFSKKLSQSHSCSCSSSPLLEAAIFHRCGVIRNTVGGHLLENDGWELIRRTAGGHLLENDYSERK